VPRHLAHLTPAWLSRELEEAGLEVVRTRYAAPEYDVFSFVQTALNAAGFTHNLLYDLLRARGAKLVGASGIRSRIETAAVLALAAPLAVVGLPLTAILAIARRGATVTMTAIRRG
jgi:hypothetical protein